MLVLYKFKKILEFMFSLKSNNYFPYKHNVLFQWLVSEFLLSSMIKYDYFQGKVESVT